MSALYLYALVGAAPPGASDLGTGLAGEPLLLVPVGGLLAVAGTMAGETPAPPAASAAVLAAHDAVVRRLAAMADAILPFRFGQQVAGAAALAAALEPRAAELAAALVRVAGCVQMTLRVFGDPAAVGGAAEAAESPAGGLPSGPGTRYLAARRRAERAPLALPGVAELRAALRPLIRAEQLERHGSGRLLLSAHDLVPPGAVADYRAMVEAARALPAGPQVTVSGPWPPYAFGGAALPPLGGTGGR